MKDVRQLGCVFQDRELPESSPIFTEEHKSLGLNSTSAIHKSYAASCKHPIKQRPVARKKIKSKFFISAVRTLRNLRIGLRRRLKDRGNAWRLAKNILKLKRNGQSYLLLSYQRMVSSSAILNKTGGKRVCGGFRREHMLSKKDLNSAELETVKVSISPTTVVTANGEVQTKEEATVSVKELDLFVTVKLLEDTPAVLSLGKLCEDHGYSYHWTTGQRPQLIKDGRLIKCNTANYVPIVVPCLSTGSSSSGTPTSPASLSQEAVIPTLHPHQQEVRVRVASKEHGETRRVIQKKTKT